MRRGLALTTVEVEIGEEEREIDEEGEIDAAEGVTNKVIRLYLTFTPFDYWRHTHNMHHGTSADLDHRGVGDIWTLTVEEYLAAPKRPCLFSVWRLQLLFLGKRVTEKVRNQIFIPRFYYPKICILRL